MLEYSEPAGGWKYRDSTLAKAGSVKGYTLIFPVDLEKKKVSCNSGMTGLSALLSRLRLGLCPRSG